MSQNESGDDSVPPVAAERKPKGPRREGSKIASAVAIASRHESPAILLKLLGAGDPMDFVIEEKSKIDAQMDATVAWRRSNAERKLFVEEIAGLPAETLVGVKAILQSRVPPARKAKDAQE